MALTGSKRWRLLLISVLALSLASTSFADLDTSDENLDGKIEYKDEIINSLPNMPSTTGKPATGKLQIGIKRRVDNCERRAEKGDTLHMHYRGWLKSTEEEFDNSYKRAGGPLIFMLGTGQVIKGWDQGLLGICAGEKRKLIIPPHLAYGDTVMPSIPPGSTLVFEVEAVKVVAGGERSEL